MKKSVSLSLVALLLVALCATGVFAIESSVAPSYPIASQLDFSQVSSGQTFLKINPDNFVFEVGQYYPLFNNIYIKCTSLSSTRASFIPSVFSDGAFYDGSGLMQNDLTSSGYFMQFSFNQNGYLYVRGTYSSNVQSSVLLSDVSPSISFGNTIIWEDSPSVVGESVNFSIPSGYALIVGSSSGDVEIIGRSYSIQNSWSFSVLEFDSLYRCNGSVQRILALGNIRDGFSPDLNGSSAILVPWTATNSNAFGTASSYSFNDEDDITLSSGSCFVITNPVYYGTGTLQNHIVRENAVELNVNLQLQYSTRPSLRLVALESLVNISDNQFFSYYSVFRPEVYDESGTPSVDGDTITEFFPSAPSGGGNNGQPPIDDDTSLIGIIQRFTSRVRELFNSVSSAVQTLFSSGSTFMQRLSDIFSWIPEPVSVVLVSALIIVVVVGLLKIFL